MTRQKAQDAPGEREAPEGWCDIHNVQMTHSKDGKGFFHKAGGKPGGKALWPFESSGWNLQAAELAAAGSAAVTRGSRRT